MVIGLRHPELDGFSAARPAVGIGAATGVADLAGRNDELAARLRRCIAPERLQRDVPLAALGRWRIGGAADFLVEVHSIEELACARAALAEAGLPALLIGHGSNLLFDDAGLRGAVIRLSGAFRALEFGGEGVVEAGAALWVPRFVRALIGAGLAGAVHAIGIPGTVGGLVAMNGGSQRRAIGEQLLAARVMERDGSSRWLDRAELALGTRMTSLRHDGRILLSARFRFVDGDPAALRREALALLAARRRKFPQIRANCGSVFVSDPAQFAAIGAPGAAIEAAGLKGVRIGDARIATEHANFIVNLGQARSRDVLALVALARERVLARTGVAMRAEVRHVAPDGTVRPAHEAVDLLGSAERAAA